MERSTSSDHLAELLAQRAWVRRVARALVLDDSRAEDLEQEAWLGALRGVKPGSPRAWLGTVLRRAASNMRRAEGRRTAHESAAPPPAPLPTPEEMVERAEVVERVWRAVRGLEEPYRETVLLRFFEDIPPAVIGERLGVPVETVRTRLRRALSILRQRLDDEEGGDRRRWAVLLFPFARPSVPWAPRAAAGGSAPAAAVGVLFMTLKAKAALTAAALLLVAGVAWWTRPSADRPAPEKRPDPAVAALRDLRATTPPAESKPLVPTPEVESPVPGVVGRVLDPGGRPVPGATVLALPDFGPFQQDGECMAPVAADRDGAFRIPLPPVAPTFRLVAVAPGFGPAGAARVRPGDDVTLTLGRSIVLEGRTLDQEGMPVPGARVRYFGIIPGGLLVRSTVADAGGSYRLEGIPDLDSARSIGLRILESTKVLADAPGFAPLSVEWSPGVQSAPHLDLYMARGAVLEGRVVEGDTDHPVAGARVILWTFEHPEPAGPGNDGLFPLLADRRSCQLSETSSGQDGTFRFECVPASGVHEVRSLASGRRGALLGVVGVVAPGFCPGSDEVPIGRDGARIDALIRLWPAASVKGRVVDAAGDPVEGVRLFEFTQGRTPGWLPLSVHGVGTSTAVTGPDGRYHLETVAALRGGPALAHVLASVPGRDPGRQAPCSIEVQVRAGEVAEAPDLVLAPETVPSVIVRVSDAEGRPVWGAHGSICQFAREATTGSDGVLRFYFTDDRAGNPPCPMSLVVRAPGFAPAVTPAVTPSSGEPPEVSVALIAGGKVAGRVVREGGGPVGPARIWVLDGTVPEEDLFPIRQGPVGLNGPPPEGMPRLVLLGLGDVAVDGTFEVSDLPPGPFRVRVEAGALSVSVDDVMSGARDVVLTLPPLPSRPAASVQVKVTEAGTGHPVRTASARLTRSVPGPDGRTPGRTEWANADGGTSPDIHRWSGLAEGVWTVSVDAAGFVPFWKAVTVTGAETVEVAAVLGRGAIVQGTLRADDGVEVRDLYVNFVRVGRSIITTGGTLDHSDSPPFGISRADGTYEVRGLRAGTWRAVVSRPSPGEPYYAVTGETIVEVPAEGGVLRLDLRVVRAGLLAVHFEGERREFPSEERVPYVVQDGEGREVHRGVVLGVGMWDFGPAPPGTLTVMLSIPGKGVLVRTVTITEGLRSDLALQFP